LVSRTAARAWLEDVVPQRGGQVAVGLVLQLEEDLLRSVPIVLGDLPPQSHEPLGVALRVGVERIEVVEVDDDGQVVGEREAHEMVHAFEECGIDRPRSGGPGPRVPTHGESDRIEPGLGDDREEPILDRHPPFAFETRGFERVAQVHAAAEPLDGLCRRPGLRLRSGAGRYRKHHDQQHDPELPEHSTLHLPTHRILVCGG
jgi:hypothetical protein